MPKDYLDVLTLEFAICDKLRIGEAASDGLSILKSLGFKILNAGGCPIADVDSRINKNGNILAPLVIEGDRISADPVPARAARAKMATFSILANDRVLSVHRSLGFSDQEIVDSIAQGLLDLGRFLYPHFRPAYGSIGELSGELMDYQAVRAARMERVYWANFFGPEYVDRIGAHFLSAAPGATDMLEDGGMLYVATESFHDWWVDAQTSMQDYFRRLSPKIDLYRPTKPVDPFLQ